jgi:hypothetical protein
MGTLHPEYLTQTPPQENLSRIQETIHKVKELAGRVLLATSLVASANAVVDSTPVDAATNKYVEIGMPFDGTWASKESGQADQHTNYWGNWAEDIFGLNKDVYLNVSSPTGGTLSFSLDQNSASCGGVAGEGIVVGISLDNEKVGQVYYEHLAGVVKKGPITNGMKLGTTKNWGKSDCYQPGSDAGVHTHFEAKSDSGNYSCWYQHSVGESLSAGAIIGRLGKTSATGKKEACSSTTTTPAPSPVPGSGNTTIGTYNPNNGMFYMRNSNTGGAGEISLQYGNNGWIPLSGDWDANGTSTPGVYNPNTAMFYLRNSNSTGPADNTFQYGNIGMKPIVGDWDANGYDSIGAYDPNNSTFYLRNMNSAGPADYTVQFGNNGWLPFTGDWDGNKYTNLGVYNPNTATYYLRNTYTSGPADITVQYGNIGMLPIAGDWDGNGFDSIGAYDPANATFHLRNSNSVGPANVSVQFGNSGWLPVVGNWDGK